jgi:hypothetical protein
MNLARLRVLEVGIHSPHSFALLIRKSMRVGTPYLMGLLEPSRRDLPWRISWEFPIRLTLTSPIQFMSLSPCTRHTSILWQMP